MEACAILDMYGDLNTARDEYDRQEMTKKKPKGGSK
jgi:hypothetical protein